MLTIEVRQSEKYYSWFITKRLRYRHLKLHYPHGRPAYYGFNFPEKRYYMWGIYFGNSDPGKFPRDLLNQNIL